MSTKACICSTCGRKIDDVYIKRDSKIICIDCERRKKNEANKK